MKKLLFILVLLALCLSVRPAYAASEPPTGLAGTITVLANDANSITLLAAQTGGTPVTLFMEHSCYADDVYAGMEKVKFIGSETATFNIGPRVYRRQVLNPNRCWVYLTFYYSSSRQDVLVLMTTKPAIEIIPLP